MRPVRLLRDDQIAVPELPGQLGCALDQAPGRVDEFGRLVLIAGADIQPGHRRGLHVQDRHEEIRDVGRLPRAPGQFDPVL